MNNNYNCPISVELINAASNFKYWVDVQRPGSVKLYGNKKQDIRDTELYHISSSVISLVERSFDDGNGPICPNFMAMRAMPFNVLCSECTNSMMGELIDVLVKSGVISGHEHFKTIESIFDRVKIFFPGRFVADRVHS